MEPRQSQNGNVSQNWTPVLQNVLGFALAANAHDTSLSWKLAAGTLAAATLATLFRPARRYHPRQVALITGGARGLELALAHRFGRAGLRLVLATSDEADLQDAIAELLAEQSVPRQEDVLLVPLDPTDPEQAQALIEVSIETFGRIDLVVCSSGTPEVDPIKAPPEAQVHQEDQRAPQSHFSAAFHTIQAALPHLLEPTDGDESCRGIVTLGPASTQFSLTYLDKSLQAQLRNEGLRVTNVRVPVTPKPNPVQSAKRIYKAVQAGRAEISLTRKAWLRSRANAELDLL